MSIEHGDIWRDTSTPALPGEEWRPVRGYEGVYEVSSLGRVRSAKSGRVRSLKRGRDGYLTLNLKRRGKCFCASAHRLVAQAFLGPAGEGQTQVNHKNEIRTDNRAENLEWCTPAYNASYGRHTDRIRAATLGSSRAQRAVEMFDLATGETIWTFPSVAEAARLMRGTRGGHILAICDGAKGRRSWRGHGWRYAKPESTST